MEIKINVSSESSRNIDPNNTPSKFKTIFDKPLTLDQNKTYVFGLDKIETITYSWYNISDQYKNNKIRYGIISEEKDGNKKVTYYNIQFSPGSYSYNNISEYIKDILIINGHLPDAIKMNLIYQNLNVSYH